MKVEGPKGPNATSKSKRTSSAQGTGGADFSQYVQGGVSSAAGASPTQSIAQLDALLAVQAAEDPTQKAARKRAHQRAEVILDKLEQVRLRILGGNLTVGHMIDVADVIASHRDKVNDPVLTAIMDEIDLRAQVELAKMRVTLEGQ